MSPLPRNMGCPFIAVTAASVLTRVLVLRLLNMRAMVWPDSLPARAAGVVPDLMEALWEEALVRRVLNSVGVRSAMERRWRGAKGEVSGWAGLEGVLEEEYERLESCLRACPVGRREVLGGIFVIELVEIQLIEL